jgi:hypothetical protein
MRNSIKEAGIVYDEEEVTKIMQRFNTAHAGTSRDAAASAGFAD